MKGASPGSRTYASASLPLIAFSSPLMAATLTVDIADDTCSNIDGAPYCSIGAALSYAVNDDLILVRPGTYNEVPRFGGKAVTLVSEGGPEITVINGGGSATTVIMGPGGTLEGFKITGGKSSYGGGVAVSGYGSVIKSNIFDGNIQTAGGSGAAIHGNGASPVIEGNIFKNNSCDSQLLSGTVGFINTSSPVIRYNVFVANSCRGLNITVPSAASPIVHNNVFVQNPVGLHFDRRISTASQTYRNNIFYNNTVGIEVLFGDENYNPVFSNNIVYGNTTDYDGMDDQTGSNGNLSVDPAFVDAAARDYRQTLYSPGIDAGYNFVLSAPDFFGNPTPADGNGDETATTDIGIHEVHPPIADAGPDQEAALSQRSHSTAQAPPIRTALSPATPGHRLQGQMFY